jgi:hypothetical protein
VEDKNSGKTSNNKAIDFGWNFYWTLEDASAGAFVGVASSHVLNFEQTMVLKPGAGMGP